MEATGIVERIATLPTLAVVPRHEFEWLVAHGALETYQAGSVMVRMGVRIERLWIVLAGHIVIRVDRGAGPRLVTEWRTGDVLGMLPYSRMKGPPGDLVVEQPVEVLAVPERDFPAMISRCPTFTAHTVHLMLDRARDFNTSDLHDEKMLSLGKLAAGLAHELNNPASAAVRGAKLLLAELTEADSAARALGASRLTEHQRAEIDRLQSACAARPADAVLSPVQLADREDEIAVWLERHASAPAYAAPLAATAVTLEALDSLAEALEREPLDAALRWLAVRCTTKALAVDIECAAVRIHELVSAVKKFTYMDNPASPESVQVESSLRDTLRVMASKAGAKGIAISLDVESELPPVRAAGGELNQVWLNLIDNALDAAPRGGHVAIAVEKEVDRIVVRIVDDGPGIPGDVLSRIFDPFFTTKPPGQGTGLGLDIARRLVRRYRGDIGVDSRPGRSEFRVSLRLADSESGGSGPAAGGRD